ncbi:MAG: hypothetical protein M5T52_15055 [Ignavibacteriaceae bacterium]|nr:hypothetical protein [Ignavibacteriaceae bacterium]
MDLIKEMKKLNLGCGKDIKDGYINLDIVDYGGNQIHDINSFPYPFKEDFLMKYTLHTFLST